MRITLLAIAGLAAGYAIPGFAPSDEPPLKFVLHLDGHVHELQEGREVQLVLGDRKVSAKITVADTRRFHAASIAFDYPRNMSFEYELSEFGYESWALDGNDTVLTVFAFESGAATDLADIMLRGIASSLGSPESEDLEVEEEALEMGGKKYVTRNASCSIADHRVQFTAIAVEVSGRPLVIMLQDSGPVEGRPSTEAVEVRRLLATSFELAPQ